MRRFRLMSLPLIVGAMLLFFDVPRASAGSVISWAPIAEGNRITGAGLFDLKSMFAGAVANQASKSSSVLAGVRQLTVPPMGAFIIDANHFMIRNGAADRVWILAFVALPAGSTVTAGSITQPITIIPLSTITPVSVSEPASAPVLQLTAAAVTTQDTVPTPEPSSLVYLGSGLVVSGGLLMRRRKNLPVE